MSTLLKPNESMVFVRSLDLVLTSDGTVNLVVRVGDDEEYVLLFDREDEAYVTNGLRARHSADESEPAQDGGAPTKPEHGRLSEEAARQVYEDAKREYIAEVEEEIRAAERNLKKQREHLRIVRGDPKQTTDSVDVLISRVMEAAGCYGEGWGLSKEDCLYRFLAEKYRWSPELCRLLTNEDVLIAVAGTPLSP